MIIIFTYKAIVLLPHGCIVNRDNVLIQQTIFQIITVLNHITPSIILVVVHNWIIILKLYTYENK